MGVPAHHLHDRLGAALERNRFEFGAGLPFDQPHQQLSRSARRGNARGERARIALGGVDKFFEGFIGRIDGHHQRLRILRKKRNRRVVFRPQLQIGPQSHRQQRETRHRHHRVRIAAFVFDIGIRNRAAATGAIGYGNRLRDPFVARENVRHHPREDVGAATGRGMHHDLHRPRRKTLTCACRRRLRLGNRRRNQRRQSHEQGAGNHRLNESVDRSDLHIASQRRYRRLLLARCLTRIPDSVHCRTTQSP